MSATPSDKCSTPSDKPVLWWVQVWRSVLQRNEFGFRETVWIPVVAKNWSVARQIAIAYVARHYSEQPVIPRTTRIWREKMYSKA